MKLIKPSFEIIKQGPGLLGIYKQIELAGRTCYKSESNITDKSAEEFVDRMFKLGHGAMLEHGTVYLTIPDREPDEFGRMDYGHVGVGNYSANKYSKVTYKNYYQEPNETQKDYCSKIPRTTTYITTNLRVLVENGWFEDLQYLCEPTEHHEKRVTVKFICDRGVTHEFVRHRTMSFAQESTRYCNYSKDKFNKELTFILPPWMDDIQRGQHDPATILSQAYGFIPFECEPGEYQEILFLETLAYAEINYNTLIEQGWKPQEARAVLPNAIKSELIMTGFVSDWKHFFDLRAIGTTGAPHPQAKELAEPLLQEFINNKYL